MHLMSFLMIKLKDPILLGIYPTIKTRHPIEPKGVSPWNHHEITSGNGPSTSIKSHIVGSEPVATILSVKFGRERLDISIYHFPGLNRSLSYTDWMTCRLCRWNTCIYVHLLEAHDTSREPGFGDSKWPMQKMELLVERTMDCKVRLETYSEA